jgi:hypothetical protein
MAGLNCIFLRRRYKDGERVNRFSFFRTRCATLELSGLSLDFALLIILASAASAKSW